ncbi:hypothetical protein PL8927_270069 [Planktothrix serta PCC 8927]|uniref:G domain-containing protein n=1 Tax=Planktothrix serta PCC 8927 TaxID=671068 RepID=A0A7Z9BHA3_9CYAN|nr:DUF3482 domain-containing protein [Planktothrix serta]VXD13632.1 hypothetical protein PL8927_270069 [Planktothrix serta PCC 8927]
MDTKERVRIAVTGHTNTGKTTLIRTLMRTVVGEVRDSSNVTQEGQAYDYSGLQAIFVDTPGFQHGLRLTEYLDEKEEDPNYKLPRKTREKLRFDLSAIESLQTSQVALYVGSLSIVPDDSYKEELSVVKRVQPKVVGVLNQTRKQLTASDEDTVAQRIAQWEKVFKEHDVEYIVFDAFWDKPAKVNEIYHAISSILDNGYRSLFIEGLNQFKIRQAEIRQESCSMLATCIRECQEQAISVRKGEFLEKEAREKIAKKMYDANLVFLTKVFELYKIAAEFPTESKDEIKLRMTDSIDLGARFRTGSLVATVIGTGAAAIGATIGAGVGALLGGVSVIAGLQVGAQIGGMLGSALGSTIVFSDNEDNVQVKLESKEIEQIAVANLAAIWGLSNLGFGRGTNLAQNEILLIKNKIFELKAFPSDLDWITVSQQEIIGHCEAILKALEEEDL